MATSATDGIRTYLVGLEGGDAPVVDLELVQRLKGELASATDPIEKLRLHSALEAAEAGETPDRSGEEAVFVAEAKAWAEAEGISVASFQALGVPDDVLRRAGFTVTAAKATKATGTKGAARAPRIPMDQVRATIADIPDPFTLRELAEALDRDTTTARNYVTKLVSARELVDKGEGTSSGPGRAPRLYGAP